MDPTLSHAVLNAIPRCYLSLARSGEIQSIPSLAYDQILGQKTPRLSKIEDFIALDSDRLGMFAVGLDQYFDNFMPIDVTLSMMPKKMHIAGRVVALTYIPLLDAAQEPQALVLEMSDVTKDEAQSRIREILFERNTILLRILKQKEAFLNFLKDSEEDLKALSSDPEEAVGKRLLHTLKGNSASFGLSDIASRVHEIEDEAAQEIAIEGSETYFRNAAHEVSGLIDTFLIENFPVLGVSRQDSGRDSFQISEQDLGELERQLGFLQSSSAAHETIAKRLRNVRSKPAQIFISTFESTVERLAQTFEKKIQLKVEGAEIRIDPNTVGPVLRELIHVIRNSCDHGIESVEKRSDAGKEETGHILLLLRELSGDRVEITIQDDGAGIDSDRLSAAAVKKGLITAEEAQAMSPSDKMMLLFYDGVSTAEKTTAVSGRGVGMAALKQRIDETRGTVDITSEKGKGTVFRIVLPQFAENQKTQKNHSQPRISWDGSLSIGIQAMDNQHKKIIAYLSDLQDHDIALQRGEKADMGRIESLLEALLSYTSEHFAEEEALLERYAYPDLGAHQILHARLIEQLQSLTSDFKIQGTQVLPRLTHFTMNWLRGHILGNDRKYGQFIGQQHLEWNSSLLIGIPDMDTQHQILIEYVNQLKALSRQAFDGTMESYAPVGQVVDQILDYTVNHFREEETLLEEAGYPDLERHKLLHSRLIKKALAFKARFEKDPLKVIPALSAFLTNWLIVHIQGEDKKYAEYLIHSEGAADKPRLRAV